MDMTFYREDGSCETFSQDNLIVDDGFDFISDVIGNATQPGFMSHVAIGTGTTGEVGGDSALETELLRKTATYNHVGGTKVFTLEATFLAGEGTGAITEAGMLNNAVGGLLLDRLTFPVKNKGALDELTVRFTFTLS